jgi:heptaprenyl diphosphate synthase
VKREASSHPLLGSEAREIREPLLATLLLFSAKFGNYDFERVKPAAVAVELLELAVEKHYPTGIELPGGKGTKKKGGEDETDTGAEQNTREENLALITGDYYYSRAILLVAGLKDVFAIKVLAEAIADVADAITIRIPPDISGDDLVQAFCDKVAKFVALYDAACLLGGYLSGLTEDTLENLRSFGLGLGGLFYVSQYFSEDKVPAEIKEKVTATFLNSIQTVLQKFVASGFEVEDISSLIKEI